MPAFSILELSLVLVAIGLFVGGGLAMQNYLRTAHLITVVNEGKIQLAAWRQFEQRYRGAIPGDMADAAAQWPAAFNGNGNGLLVHEGGPTAEWFYAWQHLRLAGLVSGGDFTGASGPGGTTDPILGTNVPTMRLESVSGYFQTAYSAAPYEWSGASSYFDGQYGHFLTIGRVGSNTMPCGGFLSPEEAAALDDKFDDGVPASGTLRTGNVASCAPNATAYATTTTTDQCNLLLLQNQ